MGGGQFLPLEQQGTLAGPQVEPGLYLANRNIDTREKLLVDALDDGHLPGIHGRRRRIGLQGVDQGQPLAQELLEVLDRGLQLGQRGAELIPVALDIGLHGVEHTLQVLVLSAARVPEQPLGVRVHVLVEGLEMLVGR